MSNIAYGQFAVDHPSILFAYGFLPQQTVEPHLMANSFDAMMAGGWDGSKGHAPGFPNDGSWQVEHED
mgnify:CR=1 FL=1